jgi:hypothetical protein
MSKLLNQLFTGAWSSSTAYTIGDIVTLSGSSYICITNHTNHTPPNATYWALLAQAGTNGTNGEVLLSGNQTFTGIKTFTTGLLKVADIIDTVRGLKVLAFASVASAVNWIKMTSSATGTPVIIEADGSDSDINLKRKPKGAGVLVDDGAVNYAADAGASDTYAVTITGISAYTAGLPVRFKANTVNTGPATLNVNGLGAKTIKKNYNTDLTDGDILANQIVEVVYDGTNFQLETPSANIANIFTPAYCKAYLSAAQVIPNNTNTIINFPNEELDTNTMHDAVTNNSRITIKTAGVYLVGAQANFNNTNTTGRRVAGLQLNGSALPGAGQEIFPIATGNHRLICSPTLVSCSVNDYIELNVYQTSGGNMDVNESDTNAGRTSMFAVRVA